MDLGGNDGAAAALLTAPAAGAAAHPHDTRGAAAAPPPPPSSNSPRFISPLRCPIMAVATSQSNATALFARRIQRSSKPGCAALSGQNTQLQCSSQKMPRGNGTFWLRWCMYVVP
jgi:hypothetical protein